METYFKIKTFLEFAVPIILLIIWILIMLIFMIWAVISSYKETKIKKYMFSNGYERYLRDVASFGNKDWWAYRKDNISIDEEELYKMSYGQVKKKFK